MKRGNRGRLIGRIWKYEYPNHPWTGLGPWHWSLQPERFREKIGHAPTLEAAMAEFRATWDRKLEKSGVA